MSAPRREAIEAVLRNYQLMPTRGTALGPSDAITRDCLVNDLLALCTPPTPDRAGLARIIDNHYVESVMRCECTLSHSGTLIQEIMAWATGQALKQWCKHLQFVANYGHDSWFMELQGGRDRLVIPDNWNCCPVKDCHAPRPTP